MDNFFDCLPKELPREAVQVFASVGENMMEKERLKNYFQSFAFTDSVSGKRFGRYVQKAKDAVMDLYMKKFYPALFSSEKIRCLEDVILLFFYDFYHWTGRSATPNEGRHSFLLDCIRIPSAVTENNLKDNDAWKADAIKNSSESRLGMQSVDSIIEKEIYESCRYYIRDACTQDSSINEAGYFRTLPRTPLEAARLLEMILQAVYLDIEIMAREPAARDAAECPELSVKAADMERGMEEKCRQIANLEEELADEKEKSLNAAEKAREETAADYEKKLEYLKEQADSANEACREMERINAKLKQEHDALVKECADLKKRLQEKGVQPEDEEGFPMHEAYTDLDMEGRYIFFANENNAFTENILELFPNASFYSSAVKLGSVKADMVIVITAHIKHSDYYSVKQQCRDYGIPFVQCRYTNARIIKNLMWEMINFGRCSGWRKNTGP